MQLTDIKEIKGKIILKSGLHIGAGDTEMHIGGTDNPVLKHPHTQEPYIPGSSIKGKVRSMLEMESGLMVKTKGEPVQLKTLKGLTGDQEMKCKKILKIFGSSGSDADELSELNLGPTRVSFADCPMTPRGRKKPGKTVGICLKSSRKIPSTALRERRVTPVSRNGWSKGQNLIFPFP